MRRAVVLVPVMLVVPLLVTACEVEVGDCTPTTMTAQDASKVDLSSAGGSAVLTGRLTIRDSGKGLVGSEVTVTLRDGGSDVDSVSTTSGSKGAVSYDLKRVDASELVALARADSFSLSFAGDSTYCSSSAEASFRAVGGSPL